MVLYLRESREVASLKTGGNTDFIFALNGQPFRAFVILYDYDKKLAIICIENSWR